tara:strand:- start:4149 stop:4862 length:714 start_codon:yes stop_codon:yes gene_type:complete
MIRFTIIIPIFNETESIFKLLEEILHEFRKKVPEIIIIDDGSTDGFKEKVKILKIKSLKVMHHKNNLGKCKAMETGVKAAKYNLICVMDGDGQNPPYEINKLIDSWIKIPEEKKKYAIICGNRKKRADTFIKRFSSKVANKIRKLILNDDCNDTACAFKVFRKQDYIKIDYFKNMHRFLPALFKMFKGKVYNVLVDDRKRLAGYSKFNFNNRFWVGVLDLVRVWILINKKKGEWNDK